VKVPGPVDVQLEPVAAQLFVPPPTPVQLFMAVQVCPFPLYPVWQAQV